MARRTLKVVLGVTGSIAAYKSAEIVRGLVKAGHEVRCALTPTASQFVTPLTLATLSRGPVAQTLHDPALWDMAHLSWSSWAELVLIAPATADFIARLAHGRAEGLLDSLVLAATCRVAVCPAMDLEMWAHKATARNVELLRGYGYEIWGPADGELASGKKGLGRMLDPEEIVSRASASPKKS
jgi:phosphopantothenoylcysteine decarboxylase / phosphopantothenate---cysteine ligase